jgi:serine/threonine protein kinase
VPKARSEPAPGVTIHEKLGEGGFGVVHLARCTRTGEACAVKKVVVRRGDDGAEGRLELLRREVELQRSLKHRHIVEALWHRVIQAPDSVELRIGLELLEGGTLRELLGRGALEESVLVRYARQLVLGMAHLHTRLVVHRDLKCDNLLLSKDRQELKVADFGLALKLASADETVEGRAGTWEWQAPEVLLKKQCGLKSDVWSLGCSVWEMASAKRPWAYLLDEQGCSDDVRLRVLRKNTWRAQPRLPQDLSAVGRQFIRGCMQARPDSRLRAVELMDTKFLAQSVDCAARKRCRRDVEAAFSSENPARSMKRYRDDAASVADHDDDEL